MLALCSLCTAIVITGCASAKWSIDNPYESVKWSKYEQHKANFHTHTTQSDGRLSPAAVIDEYRQLDYSVLALTDHNRVTWEWEVFDRDPESLGMIAVQGSEPSHHHHMGAYFCEVQGSSTEAETLENIRKQNGIAVMFHPGRYNWTVNDYVDLYKVWDELIGMEIFNQGDRYPSDRQTWDKVLTVLIPEKRPVWGFSNDDMHSEFHLGQNWNVLLMPELSSEAVRTAMETGAFFFVFAPEGHKGTPPPKINLLKVDRQKGIIRLKASDYERIEWISNGVTVHEGELIDLSTKTDVQGYVRAVVYAKDSGALIGTQPLRIQRHVK